MTIPPAPPYTNRRADQWPLHRAKARRVRRLAGNKKQAARKRIYEANLAARTTQGSR